MKIDNSKIFISYSRKDSAEFAIRLNNDLRSKGLNVWLDKLDIESGEIWDNAIEKALGSSEQFLIILSPESVASVNVMDELNFALEEGKKIIPVLYISCKIPFRIRRRQYCDFTKKYDDGLKDLLKEEIVSKKVTKVELNQQDVPSNSKIDILQKGSRNEINWINEKEGFFIDDRDNQKYKVVKIGDQIWMAENLKATKFNDGMAIQLITDNANWGDLGNLKTPGYCWYNNDEGNKKTYGVLYNWHAVNTGKLCPTNWHVPTDEEWIMLIDSLGGEKIAGGKLKEVGTKHWDRPNTGASNESGFTGLPGGECVASGEGFIYIGEVGIWWGATEDDGAGAWAYFVYNEGAEIDRGDDYGKNFGFSVRCLLD